MAPGTGANAISLDRPMKPKFFSNHWVMSAKKEETQIRRLEQLIESSAKGVRMGVIVPKPKE